MKALIPAKGSSTRVKDKNWRTFHKNKSLVEIKIEQLLQYLNPQDIFLSCDDIEKQKVVEKYEINFILRDPKYASDNTSWSEVVTNLVDSLPCHDHDDIAWIEVVNPLFDDFKKVFDTWDQVKSTHDSLALVRPHQDYLLDERGQAVNFNFGRWHKRSQDLTPLFSWESLNIMKKKDIQYFNYVIGKNPYLYKTTERSIDIDDMMDFELAQFYYEKKVNNE